MSGYVIEIAVSTCKEASAKATSPCLLSSRILDNTVGMWASGAAVRVFMMLIERVGAPENAVAVRTRVALVALVEFILVSLPVKLTLEGDVAKGAPVRALRFRGPSVVALD